LNQQPQVIKNTLRNFCGMLYIVYIELSRELRVPTSALAIEEYNGPQLPFGPIGSLFAQIEEENTSPGILQIREAPLRRADRAATRRSPLPGYPGALKPFESVGR